MAKFKIGDDTYEVPSLDTFTLGEAVVFYEYTGVPLDEIEEMPSGHPGLTAALVHVALARANPKATKQQIQRQTENVGMIEVFSSFEDDEEEDDSQIPPAEEPSATVVELGSDRSSNSTDVDSSASSSEHREPSALSGSGSQL